MESQSSERKRTTEEIQDAQIGLLEWQIEIDSLTGVKNLEAFKAELDRLLEIIHGKIVEQRHGVEPLREIAVLFVDLDYFGKVNTKLGHEAANEVLRKVTDLLKDALRGGDTLARYGGDEFVALLPNTNEEHAVATANKLREALDNDPELKKLGVTASLGVCFANASSEADSTTLIDRADKAAYVAKRSGRNRVEVYSD